MRLKDSRFHRRIMDDAAENSSVSDIGYRIQTSRLQKVREGESAKAAGAVALMCGIPYGMYTRIHLLAWEQKRTERCKTDGGGAGRQRIRSAGIEGTPDDLRQMAKFSLLRGAHVTMQEPVRTWVCLSPAARRRVP